MEVLVSSTMEIYGPDGGRIPHDSSSLDRNANSLGVMGIHFIFLYTVPVLECLCFLCFLCFFEVPAPTVFGIHHCGDCPKLCITQNYQCVVMLPQEMRELEVLAAERKCLLHRCLENAKNV